MILRMLFLYIVNWYIDTVKATLFFCKKYQSGCANPFDVNQVLEKTNTN